LIDRPLTALRDPGSPRLVLRLENGELLVSPRAMKLEPLSSLWISRPIERAVNLVPDSLHSRDGIQEVLSFREMACLDHPDGPALFVTRKLHHLAI
jgi:hypothetical protein